MTPLLSCTGQRLTSGYSTRAESTAVERTKLVRLADKKTWQLLDEIETIAVFSFVVVSKIRAVPNGLLRWRQGGTHGGSRGVACLR